MRVTYYGQACTLIEAAGRKILVDPWLTEGAYSGTWYHTHLLADANVRIDTFDTAVDYIYLSHEHHDHTDAASLRHFAPDTPILICRFSSSRFRRYLESLGLRNIRELAPRAVTDLGDGLEVTALAAEQYTNDSAILVSAEGHTVFNETDCKLGYDDLERVRDRGVDIGFFMFSGANWYPMLYDTSEPVQLERVERRRRALLRGFVERVKLVRPRIAVPAAGPCTVLDPDRLWLNSEARGIFIDPEAAVQAGRAAGLASDFVYLRTSDAWDSETGIERHAPASLDAPRMDYIADAAARMAPDIQARQAAEPQAACDLPQRLAEYFESRVAALTPATRSLIGATLGIEVTGRHGGGWTVDFAAPSAPYVREGLSPDWTYRLTVGDSVLYPFLTGHEPFFEDLFLSLRVGLARRPDVFNEPLYHFFYDPDPGRLHDWYAPHRR